jgi:hypothetical protein
METEVLDLDRSEPHAMTSVEQFSRALLAFHGPKITNRGPSAALQAEAAMMIGDQVLRGRVDEHGDHLGLQPDCVSDIGVYI